MLVKVKMSNLSSEIKKINHEKNNIFPVIMNLENIPNNSFNCRIDESEQLLQFKIKEHILHYIHVGDRFTLIATDSKEHCNGEIVEIVV